MKSNQAIGKFLKNAVMAASFTFLSASAQAQDNGVGSGSQRDGFLFEASLGGGIISVEDSDGAQSFDKVQGGISFPELKLGYMLNDRFALTASMPGMIYGFQGYDRHFGGFIPSVQYWAKDNWWIHGGVGLAMDSPALYDIKGENDVWNFGCAVMASTGYEVVKKENFALNIQSKLVLGRTSLDNDVKRDAVSISIGVGFSWF